MIYRLLLLSALFCPLSLAQETVIWGVYDRDYRPYMQHHKDGSMSGIDYDLTQEIFRRMPEYRLKAIKLPINRLAKGTLNGSVDFAYNTKSPDVDHLAQHADISLRSLSNAMIATIDSPLSSIPLSQLNNITIGVLNVVPVPAEIKQLGERDSITLTGSGGIDQLLQMLQRGRIDALVLQTEMAFFHARKLGIKVKAIPHLHRSSAEFYAMISRNSKLKDWHHFNKRYSQTLQAMKEDGSYERIIARHIASLEADYIELMHQINGQVERASDK